MLLQSPALPTRILDWQGANQSTMPSLPATLEATQHSPVKQAAPPIRRLQQELPPWLGPNKNAISWHSVAGASGYTLHHSESTPVTTSDSSLTVSGTSYTHTSLDAAKTYYYAVIADSSTGSSPIFERVSAQLIPGAPTLTVGTNTETTVTITWNTVSGANVYRLHSSTSPSVKETDNITIVAGNFHTVSGLTSGDTRYFAMISENSVS